MCTTVSGLHATADLAFPAGVVHAIARCHTKLSDQQHGELHTLPHVSSSSDAQRTYTNIYVHM